MKKLFKIKMGIILLLILFSTFLMVTPALVKADESNTQLIFGPNFGPVNLDPHYTYEIPSIDVIDQVVETLFAYDLSDPELGIIPRLASNIGSWSDDYLTYTVPLRTDVKFHDGTDFNATAVKWNFDRLAYFMNLLDPLPPEIPITQFSTLYLWPDGTPIINSIEFEDSVDDTVKFVLNRPYVPFEALLCFSGSGIMSPTSTPPEDYIDTAGDLVGTGPFVIDEYIGNEVGFHAWEDYWEVAPNIDELTFLIISDPTQALLDGDVDFIKTPDYSRLQELRDKLDITLEDAGQSTAIYYLGMNNKQIPLVMRKAISYALDYDFIIEELMDGEAVRLRSPIPLGIPYANWDFKVPETDIIRARQTLIDSELYEDLPDVTDDEAWLVLTSSENPIAIYNYTYNIGNPTREAILTLLQDNLAKIGVKVIDAGMSWLEYLNRGYEIGGLHRDMLQLFWLGWAPDYNDPSNFINPLFTNKAIAHNFAQVDDKKVQLWMEKALFERNPARRERLYKKIQKRLVNQVFPWCWGYVRRNYDAYSNEFTGFQSNPMDKVWFYFVSPIITT